MTASDYCETIVRNYDKDRYLVGLCYPAAIRRDLWPLFAFNHEIAKTREVVSEPMLGLIRLQWWRDALAGIYNGQATPGHEILGALADIIRRHDLPQLLFEALINARARDMDTQPFADIDEVQAYAVATNKPLTLLAMQIVGEEAPDADVDAFTALYGLTGILRAEPFREGQGRSFLTALSSQPVEAVRAVADRIHALAGRQPFDAPYLRRGGFLAKSYINLLKSNGCNLTSPVLARPPLGFLLRAMLGIA